MMEIFNNASFVIMGDFNARLGNLNCLDKELFYSTNMFTNRYSLHPKITTRGKMLIEVMEQNKLILCNG